MKFGQLTLQKACRKWSRETSFRPLFVFQKTLFKVKGGGQHLVLIYFGRPQLGHTIKTNFITFQTVDPETYSTQNVL